ncbi:bacteriophage HK97 gp40 [Escherichia coli]|nr:bacteriophage HK97 gp40 [Escherichia coli]
MAHSITVRLNKPAREFQAGENIGFNIRAGVQYYDRQTKKERMDKLQRRCICQAGSASGLLP